MATLNQSEKAEEVKLFVVDKDTSRNLLGSCIVAMVCSFIVTVVWIYTTVSNWTALATLPDWVYDVTRTSVAVFFALTAVSGVLFIAATATNSLLFLVDSSTKTRIVCYILGSLIIIGGLVCASYAYVHVDGNIPNASLWILGLIGGYISVGILVMVGWNKWKKEPLWQHPFFV